MCTGLKQKDLTRKHRLEKCKTMSEIKFPKTYDKGYNIGVKCYENSYAPQQMSVYSDKLSKEYTDLEERLDFIIGVANGYKESELEDCKINPEGFQIEEDGTDNN